MDNFGLKFYDELAEQYHLIFPDWNESIIRQGKTLDKLIRSKIGSDELRLLDCSCGIGTQALGLAQRGYRVHGTDPSYAMIERASREALERDLEVTFGVSDFQHLDSDVEGTFDVVISCDNSLPHVQSDANLRLAVENMKGKLMEGGLLLISIRDYDEILQRKPQSTEPRLFDDEQYGKRIVFQLWDWMDLVSYRLDLFILKESDGEWQTSQFSTSYRALKRDELSTLLFESGFTEIEWNMPEKSGYYQPIVTARK